MNILNLTALQLAKEIKLGNIKCVDAVNAVLNSIKSNDGKINAYLHLNREEALKRAEEIQNKIDNNETVSPLAGVPIAIKDNICTKGLKTTCGSKMLCSFTPFYNATVIDRLENADMIVLGKTNMDEFAMGSTGSSSYFGEVKNPLNINKIPGGSSSGSAAAIAAGEAIIALGSDTGGSIRQPAAFCGLTGFKPTYGVVSRNGLIAYASSLDQIGPIAKDAEDCSAIMSVIAGIDSLDSTSLNEKLDFSNDFNFSGIKIAVLKNYAKDKSVVNLVKTLKEFGCIIEEIEIPFFDYAVAAYYIIATAEASSNLSRYDGVKYGYKSENYSGLEDMYIKTRSEGFGDEVKKRILLGTFVLSSGYYDAYYKKALEIKSMISKQFADIFKSYDFIITPTTLSSAPQLHEMKSDKLKQYTDDLFTVPVNLAGLPAISVPCGTEDNMPIGAQIIGNRLSDAKVLALAKAFQQATEYHKQILEVSQ